MKTAELYLGIKTEPGIIYLLSNNVPQLAQNRLCLLPQVHTATDPYQSVNRSVSQPLSPSVSHLVSQSVTHSACQPLSYIYSLVSQ